MTAVTDIVCNLFRLWDRESLKNIISVCNFPCLAKLFAEVFTNRQPEEEDNSSDSEMLYI